MDSNLSIASEIQCSTAQWQSNTHTPMQTCEVQVLAGAAGSRQGLVLLIHAVNGCLHVAQHVPKFEEVLHSKAMQGQI